ncbi:hypothetical protein ATJ88_1412 [Isoptericola jiangsuensis]|uniref:Uncharacterized protein n=2 Tax=Isoptericola jiangsuensis TaxID=548579 RepID=A0A2A9EW41_9MICO|nr:hypothetical protein ATJ88_1412 [Isoptericola jiangsuensis]
MDMVTFVVWLVVTLLLASAVFLVASVMERRDGDDDIRGARAFVRDFRGGLRRHRSAVPKSVDTDMDAFFAANVEDAPGYVDADELSDVLHRAQGRVRLPHHSSTQDRADA